MGSCPLLRLLQAGGFPKLLAFVLGILQTLLDLNALCLADRDIQHPDILLRTIKSLVTTAKLIIDIFANDSPFVDNELFFSQNMVGICETIKNEPSFSV
jgi:hypothetical protein